MRTYDAISAGRRSRFSKENSMRERVSLTSDSHFPFTGGAFGTTKAQILGWYTPFGWVFREKSLPKWCYGSPLNLINLFRNWPDFWPFFLAQMTINDPLVGLVSVYHDIYPGFYPLTTALTQKKWIPKRSLPRSVPSKGLREFHREPKDVVSETMYTEVTGSNIFCLSRILCHIVHMLD